MDFIEFTLPDWSLSYLINGDNSALNNEEIEKADNFCKEVIKEQGNALFIHEESLGFTIDNDIDNLAGDCSVCVIYK